MNEQQALLQALMGKPEPAALETLLPQTSPAQTRWQQRGLLAYRANAHALAERALLASYPVLTELLGTENMAALAPHFWQQYPPLRGDIAQWGQELPTFLQAASQLADEPYLADVARVEWLLHQAATAADVTTDLSSLGLLTTHAPEQLRLCLGSGVALLVSAYPVVSIICAHQGGSPSLQEAGELLRAGVAEHALVWHEGFKPKLRSCTATEFALLQTLLAGQSLHNTLAAAEDEPGFDLHAWLVQAVQTELVVGVELWSATPPLD